MYICIGTVIYDISQMISQIQIWLKMPILLKGGLIKKSADPVCTPTIVAGLAIQKKKKHWSSSTHDPCSTFSSGCMSNHYFCGDATFQVLIVWFGAQWFGFLGLPSERHCYVDVVLKIPNHQAPRPPAEAAPEISGSVSDWRQLHCQHHWETWTATEIPWDFDSLKKIPKTKHVWGECRRL